MSYMVSERPARGSSEFVEVAEGNGFSSEGTHFTSVKCSIFQKRMILGKSRVKAKLIQENRGHILLVFPSLNLVD
jgi:hypothetical protein